MLEFPGHVLELSMPVGRGTKNKIRFFRDTHLRVRPIPSLLKNNRMFPQHFSFHNTLLCLGR